MDYRVERLRTPAECESFARNAIDRNRPELASAARRKALTMQAETHPASTPLEAEAFVALYAYEMHLTRKNGRKTRAAKTWAIARNHGIIQAIQKAVESTPDPGVLAGLRELGLEDLSFDALVVRNATAFDASTVRLSKARLTHTS